MKININLFIIFDNIRSPVDKNRSFCGILIFIFHIYLVIGPRCEKTGFLHMRKQRRRSASR